MYDEIDSLFENEDADSLTEIDSRLALAIQKKSDNTYLIFRLTAIRNYLQDSRIALTYPKKVSSIESSNTVDTE